MAVNATEAGVIKEFFVSEEDTVTVGQDLVRLETGGEKPAESEKPKEESAPSESKPAAEPEQPKSQPEPTKSEKPAPPPQPKEQPEKKSQPEPAAASRSEPTAGNREERRVSFPTLESSFGQTPWLV